MPEEWRLLRTRPLSGALNMALDDVLLGAVATGRSMPVLRLYRWSPPTVSIGYAQSLAEVNQEACQDFGYEIVRRPTGGRAVLHEHECTYAVIACTGTLFAGTILDCYRVIAGALRKTVASLGMAVELSMDRRRGTQPAICFTAPAHGELLYRGCKMVGSSQKRHGRAFLQHGSIPIDLDLQRLWRVIGGESAFSGGDELSRTIGWLNRFLPSPVSIEMVEDALIAVFANELQLHFRPEEPTADEWKAARRLAEEKYANDYWTQCGGRNNRNYTHSSPSLLDDPLSAD